MPLMISEDCLVRIGGVPGSSVGGLRNTAAGGGFENAAIVTIDSVTDPDGVPVAGFPLPMDYVSASNGIYEGIIPASISSVLREGWVYRVECTAIAIDKTKKWVQRHEAVYSS